MKCLLDHHSDAAASQTHLRKLLLPVGACVAWRAAGERGGGESGRKLNDAFQRFIFFCRTVPARFKNGPNMSRLTRTQTAKAKGILIVAVTQCLRGGVSLSTYAVGVALERNGVLSGGDMTTEAVVTKLAYLFGLTNNIEVRFAL